ncbi:MAG: DUF805 domain-containing protein [Actinomycetota bacterium]|nr:DUF805 domain-containing protein [Actinomycetota bacterium]MDK1039109.1 DUF805 domain-containing protein [Actinomycetota bacterium]MDK1292061.1 DUF805 domain-containing protein [Actinomycetota bacterium]
MTIPGTAPCVLLIFIDWGHLLFKLDGRINRGKFWLGAAVIWGTVLVLGILASALNSTVIWILLAVVSIGTIWVSLAISVKRWHDRDKSGWWMLIAFVPIIGGLWAFIETGLLQGTEGDNQYGPNPLAS